MHVEMQSHKNDFFRMKKGYISIYYIYLCVYSLSSLEHEYAPTTAVSTPS